MALLPYASRVVQTRGPKRDGERGGRRERDRDLPAPDITPLSAEPDVDAEVEDTSYGEGIDEGVEETGTDDLVGADTGGSEDES
jgi:hypothetical protein